MKLDITDRKIIDILQENGRITNTQLAAEIGISPPAMLERVKRLEKEAVIRRYVALVDPDKLGKGIMAIVAVSLAVHELSSLDRFMREINKLEEVLECYHITGDDDFVLKVVVQSVKEYESFVVQKLTRVQGIRNIRTSIILSTVKYKTKI